MGVTTMMISSTMKIVAIAICIASPVLGENIIRQRLMRAEAQVAHRRRLWQEVTDKSSGNPYYYHEKTLETTWETPSWYQSASGKHIVVSHDAYKKVFSSPSFQPYKNKFINLITDKRCVIQQIFSINKKDGGLAISKSKLKNKNSYVRILANALSCIDVDLSTVIRRLK